MSILAAYAVPHPPLIIPDVGRGREEDIADTVAAYRDIARDIVALDPETIVVTSPHAPCYRDGFYVCTGVRAWGDMARFAAPRATMQAEYDQQLAHAIRALAQEADLPLSSNDPSDSDVDHATFIPLWFVNQAYAEAGIAPGYRVVRIGLSGMGYEVHRTMGRCIAQGVAQCARRVVFVASGDLSHKLTHDGPYGFAKEGPAFDEQICDIFRTGELGKLFSFSRSFADRAAECGLQSFQMMAAALAEQGGSWRSELLSHEGPFGVGYGTARVLPANQPPAESEETVDPYIKLARASVEHFVSTGAPLTLPADVSSDMTERQAGAFVSLHKHGELRGCMGTIAGTQPTLAQEIVRNGILACSQDPRFSPVKPSELDFIEYSVDVLGEPEFITGSEQLDPARYGVIVTSGGRRGLLLPNLEGIDSVQLQIAIARQKAGIDPREKDVRLQRFEVVRHTAGGQARRA